MISKSFEDELHKMIAGDKLVSSRPLLVGTPSDMLSACGADASKDITITKKVIEKAMRPELRDEEGRLKGATGHGLSEDEIVLAIKEIDEPALAFKGRSKDSILIVTEIKDSKSRNIVVAIEFNRKEAFTEVNSIRSIYGRDNLPWFIGENIEKGNLLAASKKKADDLLRSIGKSYPKENTFISFD